MFKCFQCNKDRKLKVHSFERDRDSTAPYEFLKRHNKETKNFCEHFTNIGLCWKKSWGFFTLGWKIEIYKVNVECTHCNKILYFKSQTFNSKNYWDEEVIDCCDNVIVYSAHEGDWLYGDEGIKLQADINKQIKELKKEQEEFKKLKEEAERLEKEEKMRREKEEEERREKEEKEKKERENKRRSQYERENKEMYEVMNQQEKEGKELNKRINADTSWIEEQMSQMITEAENKHRENITFDPLKEINAIYNHKIVKT